jgi:spectinomycin phosphotransferase
MVPSVLTPPSDLSAEQVSAYLHEHWGIAEAVVTYAPLGHGSHNWSVEAGGSQWFVKANRGPDSEFLRTTLASVAALGEGGLACVLAPVRSLSGAVVAEVSPEWQLTLFPFVRGRNADFASADRTLVATALGRLHAFAPLPEDAMRWEPGWYQPELRERLANDLGRPWSDGPYGERARTLLTHHREGVEALLALSDRLVERLAADDQPYVMTHGEPHGGNSMIDESGEAILIDCPMMVAPRERDLRLLLHASHKGPRGWDNTGVLAAYQRAAGPVEPREWLIEMFRAEWHLIEIARYAELFSGPHRDTADTRARIESLESYVPVAQNWPEPFLLPER